MGHQEVFESILSKLDTVSGHLGCMIVSHDGEILGSHLDKAYGQDKIAAMSTDMVNMCDRVTGECKFGHPDIIVIEGESGKIAGVNAHGKIGYIFLLGKQEMNLGMAKIMLHETVKEFEKDLGG
ncbi:roadblock/LC7 domain-containing protein [Thermodesulfobacteriota bacterium]